LRIKLSRGHSLNIGIERCNEESDAGLMRTKIEDFESFDESKINAAIVSTQMLFEDEERRRGVIESKAATLVGVTGIAASLIVGFSSFLMSTVKTLHPAAIIVLAALFFWLAEALLITGWQAITGMVFRVYARPNPNDILSLREKDVIYYRRLFLKDLLNALNANTEMNNSKASSVICAQRSFYCAIAILASIASFISFILLYFAFAG
jgi:hypothetical protein